MNDAAPPEGPSGRNGDRAPASRSAQSLGRKVAVGGQALDEDSFRLGHARCDDVGAAIVAARLGRLLRRSNLPVRNDAAFRIRAPCTAEPPE
jgi:hypothetical protein